MIATRMRQAAAGAVTFSPADISGMVFDHDCDLIPGSDGDAIASHTFEVAFSQSTSGKRPVLKKGVNGINGHNVLRFSGAQAWRSTAAINLTGTSAITCFMVANITSEAATRIFYEFGASVGLSGSFSCNTDSTNKPAWAHRVSLAASFLYATSQVGTPYCYTQIGDISLATDEETGWVNGASSGTRPNNNDNAGAFNNYVFYVGSRAESSLYATMDMARIILYNRALNSTERGQVESYLSTQYGLGF